MPILSKNFDEALQFAADLHREQTRKDTDIPYVGHLLSVAGLVLENDGTEVQAIAALLHDAIEDQAAKFGDAARLGAEIERRFGVEVRAIVEACTDAWHLRRIGNRVFDRFSGRREGTLWYYRQLALAFGKSHPQPLADELGRIVDEMEVLAGAAP